MLGYGVLLNINHGIHMMGYEVLVIRNKDAVICCNVNINHGIHLIGQEVVVIRNKDDGIWSIAEH